MMKKVYPTFIANEGNDYLVYVPDFDIYTEGCSYPDAIMMARDAIGIHGIALEDDGQEIPEASTYDEAVKKAKEDTEDFDYTTGILTLVDIDFSEYRKKINSKMVRRNVTLPSWLDFEARKAKINVSKVLQEALESKISAK